MPVGVYNGRALISWSDCAWRILSIWRTLSVSFPPLRHEERKYGDSRCSAADSCSELLVIVPKYFKTIHTRPPSVRWPWGMARLGKPLTTLTEPRTQREPQYPSTSPCTGQGSLSKTWHCLLPLTSHSHV